jgi:hypothetical protein
MRPSHVEVLVEEASMEAALRALLPKIVDVQPILAALLDRLGNREAGENATIRRIADE